MFEGKLPKTNSSPLKRGRKPKGKEVVFQASILYQFLGAMLSSERVMSTSIMGKKNMNNYNNYEHKPIPYHPCMECVFLHVLEKNNQM